MKKTNRRTRSLTAVLGAGLVLSSTGVVLATSHTAVSAAPTGDCAAPFPVADLETGDEVTGLTVAKGTTPAPFSGEVLGVIDDGIASGIDMVMVDLTSPDIDRVGSIWAGMSGSPVYASDGRLIGAVSYGLSWGPSQIAGVTPYDAMDDYLAQPSAARETVRLGKADAKVVAEAAGISTAKASNGLRRLSVPMTVSGVDPQRVKKAVKRSWLRSPLQGPGGTSRVAGPETIVAGGNLGGSVAHGMINYSGVGTVTSVCDDEVVGFGHPLAYLGATTMSMHPASAVYVQEDPAGVASKYANLGAPVGVIDNDRMAAISGKLGAVPQGTVLTGTSTFGERSHTGTSTVTVKDYLGEVAWYHFASVNDRAVDATTRGNAVVSWTVKGKDARGKAFQLGDTDRHRAGWDLASEGPGLLPDVLWALGRLDGVTVESADATSTLSTDPTRKKVVGVQRLVKGKWKKVEGGLVVKRGAKLKLRAVLSGKGTSYQPVTVKVPKRFKGRSVALFVRGGQRHGAQGNWRSVAGLQKYVSTKVRNDQVVAVLGRSTEEKAAPQFTSVPGSNVVVGQQRLRLVVK